MRRRSAAKAMKIFKNDKEKTEFVTSFSDPFDQSCVERITFQIRKAWPTKKNEYTATVWFKKNNTSGNHDLETKDFPSLVKAVESFIKSLA